MIIMPAFFLLLGLGVIIIWFTASSLFPAIGKFVCSLWENAVGDDENININEEKEKKHE